jgi:UDP-N-acetylglucosamine 4,6-dehydratase
MSYDTCLVTGGTGTFGTSYIIEGIQNDWHKKIIIYSRDEYKQLQLYTFLKSHFKHLEILDDLPPYSLKINNTEIRFFIGDICDYERIKIATMGVDLVIHAAALKHVHICEYNPMEATKVNVGGTTNVVNACGANGVSRLVALSTDKAVDPINVYGASKLCLEKLVIGGNNYYPNTSMSVVRYGNILGSRGSIIHKLLTSKESKSFITDPLMTRFWLSIEDAVALVRKSLSINDYTGFVLVPKLKSLEVGKLFQLLQKEDAEVTGPRVGEKTHEKMITEEDLRKTFYCKDIDSYLIHDKVLSFNLEDTVKGSMSSYASNSSSTIPWQDEEFLSHLDGSIISKLYKTF